MIGWLSYLLHGSDEMTMPKSWLADCRVARSANFMERKDCYQPERPLQSALQLMDRLIAEKTKAGER